MNTHINPMIYPKTEADWTNLLLQARSSAGNEFVKNPKKPGKSTAHAESVIGRKVEVARGEDKGKTGVIVAVESDHGYTRYTVDFEGRLVAGWPGTALLLHPELSHAHA